MNNLPIVPPGCNYTFTQNDVESAHLAAFMSSTPPEMVFADSRWIVRIRWYQYSRARFHDFVASASTLHEASTEVVRLRADFAASFILRTQKHVIQ